MDWHAMASTAKKKYVDVAFHIPMPNTELHSKAGLTGDQPMTLRTAIQERRSHTGEPITGVYNHQTTFSAEYTQLENAELYEHRETFKFRNANWSKERKAQELDARFNQLIDTSHKDSVVKNTRQSLRLWGYAQDVS